MCGRVIWDGGVHNAGIDVLRNDMCIGSVCCCSHINHMVYQLSILMYVTCGVVLQGGDVYDRGTAA